MIWKDIKGYEGIYQISDTGEVRSIRKIKKCLNIHGFCVVTLRKKGKITKENIHRLVAQEFIGNIDNKIVRHKNENRNDNSKENLKIISWKEKRLKEVSQGKNIKLDKKKVKEIRKTLKTYPLKTKSEIARQYNVCWQTIYKIEKGYIWKN